MNHCATEIHSRHTAHKDPTVIHTVTHAIHTATWIGSTQITLHNDSLAYRCDCPANWYCRPFLGRPDNTYADGYCTPFDESTKTCFTTLDCDTYTYGYLTLTTLRLGRFSCVNGFCRTCNISYWGAGVVKNCTTWNHVTQTGSSRPGETRECAATGYLIGGGALATTPPPPTTTTPPSATSVTTKPSTTGSTPTTSSSVTHYVSLVIAMGSLMTLVSM
jgi:hypothetical protein